MNTNDADANTEYTVTIEGYQVCRTTVVVNAADIDTAMEIAYNRADAGDVDWEYNDAIIDLEIVDVNPDDEVEDIDEE